MTGLEVMLIELESNRLEVGLAPCKYTCNEGGCVRVAFSRNATWYRRYCAQYCSSRRRNKKHPDTRIKRAETVRILGRLIEGKPVRSQYAPVLLSIAKKLQPAELVEAPF